MKSTDLIKEMNTILQDPAVSGGVAGVGIESLTITPHSGLSCGSRASDSGVSVLRCVAL